jgi:hypothetical protein
MPQPAVKLSLSVPFELAKAVRKRVGDRGVSSFVARALEHELEREQLGAYLDGLDAALGPVSKAAASAARRAWRRR